MNIVLFTDTFLPRIDGVSVSIEQSVRLLSRDGFNFLICAPKYRQNSFTQMADNIHVLRFKNAPLPSYPDVKVVLPSRKKFKRAISSFAPDLVHVHTPGLMGQYGLALAKLNGLPVVGTYHNPAAEMGIYLNPYRLLKMDKLVKRFSRGKKIKKSLPKLELDGRKTLSKSLIDKLAHSIYDRCDTVVAPNYLIKQELAAARFKRPIEVISNGVDLSRFKGKAKKLGKTDRIKLLYAGRLTFEKNVDILLESFKGIVKDFPQISLDIVGDGPAMVDLQLQAQELGVREKVRFTGFVPRNQLAELFPKYDLFVTASAKISQDIVVLEALAAGLPIVGVRAMSMPELVHNDENGYLTEPFNPAALAARVSELLRSPQKYAAFSKSALAVAAEHDCTITLGSLATLYRQLAESRLAKSQAG